MAVNLVHRLWLWVNSTTCRRRQTFANGKTVCQPISHTYWIDANVLWIGDRDCSNSDKVERNKSWSEWMDDTDGINSLRVRVYLNVFRWGFYWKIMRVELCAIIIADVSVIYYVRSSHYMRIRTTWQESSKLSIDATLRCVDPSLVGGVDSITEIERHETH